MTTSFPHVRSASFAVALAGALSGITRHGWAQNDIPAASQAPVVAATFVRWGVGDSQEWDEKANALKPIKVLTVTIELSEDIVGGDKEDGLKSGTLKQGTQVTWNVPGPTPGYESGYGPVSKDGKKVAFDYKALLKARKGVLQPGDRLSVGFGCSEKDECYVEELHILSRAQAPKPKSK
ncbi:MAG: hypothetical protein HY554_05240 [Elusimicrobia bacterium]|nr:hypothetical protein [Elusimicrobiota bacterium]